MYFTKLSLVEILIPLNFYTHKIVISYPIPEKSGNNLGCSKQQNIIEQQF